MIVTLATGLGIILSLPAILAILRRIVLTLSAALLYRPPARSSFRPSIWIVAACRNEASRLNFFLDGLYDLSYSGNLRFVLIDDSSTDGSAVILRKACAGRSTFFCRELIGRQHGKATALREGLRDLPIETGDLLLVLDFDHRLRPSALERLPDYFGDPNVEAVAIEHPVRNPGRSLMSTYCFLEAAVGENVTSRGQDALGLSTKLAGSWACRFQAFNAHYPEGWHLVDDTNFSAAIAASGKRVAYAADVQAEQDVPDTIHGYISQHLRWAAGYADLAASRHYKVASKSFVGRVDSAIMMAGYWERPLIAISAVIALLSFVAGYPAGALPIVMVLGSYAFAISLQIVTALVLSGAAAKLWFKSFASLIYAGLDLFISIKGIMASTTGRRVVWPTNHR
jgi:cellulose synthase/poly-beta-1,6-N-acetylglucosamine synthase-like glycosyltransferase